MTPELLELRLPRALLGVMVGASLGLAGAALQGLFRNPLAEPGVIGVSGCAALGAVLAFYSGLSLSIPLALPLGGIAAKRSLPEAVRRQVETLIRQSIEYAFAHPEASRAYIKEHAQELDDAVIDAHIALFVNDYSLSLGDEGRRAVEALTGIACAFNS